MGFYINPENRTKEAWLDMFGQEINSPSWPPPDNQVFVCLVSNLTFAAAGIAYNEQKFSAFAFPDGRPKRWYHVSIERVI